MGSPGELGTMGVDVRKLLIANRAEIAIRIGRGAAELGIETLAIAPEDDEACLHTRRADAFSRLEGQGVAAYLDVAQILSIAKREGCDAVHPGYGFLSESAEFAEACENAGMRGRALRRRRQPAGNGSTEAVVHAVVRLRAYLPRDGGVRAESPIGVARRPRNQAIANLQSLIVSVHGELHRRHTPSANFALDGVAVC